MMRERILEAEVCTHAVPSLRRIHIRVTVMAALFWSRTMAHFAQCETHAMVYSVRTSSCRTQGEGQPSSSCLKDERRRLSRGGVTQKQIFSTHLALGVLVLGALLQRTTKPCIGPRVVQMCVFRSSPNPPGSLGSPLQLFHPTPPSLSFIPLPQVQTHKGKRRARIMF